MNTYKPKGTYAFTLENDCHGVEKKLVTQELYDKAAQEGFTEDFFEDAILDDLKIYCVPDNASFERSILRDCEFSGCAMRGASFKGARVYDCKFADVDLSGAVFWQNTVISFTSFMHCNFSNACLSGKINMCGIFR